jgi:branched-chain amino acid aminotransferase
MILLNDAGRVAEATGACIMMARDGRLSCPPASEGGLESITVEIVEALAQSDGVAVERRPVERTELHVADELAILGTLAEVVLVHRFATRSLRPDPPLLGGLQRRFFDAVRGADPHPAVDLEYLLEIPVDLSAIEG